MESFNIEYFWVITAEYFWEQKSNKHQHKEQHKRGCDANMVALVYQL